MKRGIVCVLCVFFLWCTGCGTDVDLILQNGSGDAKETEEDLMVPEEDGPDPSIEKGQEDTVPSEIYVYICGAVHNPGVYPLQSQSRVYELVEMAGGMTQEADEGSVNLARTMEDGEMIRILTVQESAEGTDAVTGSVSSQNIPGPGDKKVNINTAGVEELTVLSGIGEAKASAIVTYREEHGPFGSIEEIMQVSGIAEGTFAKIKDDITI